MTQNKSTITGGFWKKWQKTNADSAIFHQWEQLEASGCIDNFRILAEGKEAFRQGWFFADSDAYKWLEAASAILPEYPNQRLRQLVDDFIALIKVAQDQDGYIFTYNQIHFPGTRWANLQIEHELYCHGHLIEAGVTHYQALGEHSLLKNAQKAADRIVMDFTDKGPRHTPGHEEIEIALLRLYRVTGEKDYLEMGRQFLERRGRATFFAQNLLREFIGNNRRVRHVEKLKAAYQESHPDHSVPELPPENEAKQPPMIGLRFMTNALSGKFFQQHKPLKHQTVPAGHAVRFAYLETAGAMLDKITNETRYLPALEQAWEHMVARRMVLTGGIGSLPVIEGFGRDYELDPEIVYAETCAALGCLFWNREMSLLTGDVRYSDLFEWQLYNAALVGMGLEGKTYFYNNPLAAGGDVQRRAWYEVPCCPSNLSRTFARLQEEIIRHRPGEVMIEQYINSEHELFEPKAAFSIESQFPWQGRVEIQFHAAQKDPFTLKLRQPSWATEIHFVLNGEPFQSIQQRKNEALKPERAVWNANNRQWNPGDRLVMDFAMPVRILRSDERVKSTRGKGVVTCGPLVYCLESIDNPGVDIFAVVLEPSSLDAYFDARLLGGVHVVRAKSILGENLVLIPYHLWGNRGKSSMVVNIKIVETI